MNLRSIPITLAAVLLSFVISGCNKSADQQTQGTSPDATSDPAATRGAKPRTPQPIVVPAETSLTVVLDQSVGSKISTTGQTFSATVHAPVEIAGKIAIPKGARASGIVKDAKPAGRFKGGAVLEIELTSVTVDGADHDIRTAAHSTVSKGKGKRTAAMVGGGAGGGALIGGLAGGGKGALIGGLVGAAAGTGGAAFTGNREITLPAETVLIFKLLQPLELKPKS